MDGVMPCLKGRITVREKKTMKGVVVLPDEVFVRQLQDKEDKQDEETIKRWVNLHQLKLINGRWRKDGRMVVTAESPRLRQLIHD